MSGVKVCDNTSVGVIVMRDGKIALLERAKPPVGIAPPAGHIDDHGTAKQAAIDEVFEELGLRVALGRVLIDGERKPNVCRRPGGDHHMWWVYEAQEVEGELQPSPDETKMAAWYSMDELQELAQRTKRYIDGHITEDEWTAEPGLEPIWLEMLIELGYVR